MMLIFDGKKPCVTLVGRYVEVHYLLRANPGHHVSFIEDASLSDMKEGEALFLLGHGEPNTLGDAWMLSPTELAVTLLNKGLRDNTYIVLGSCSGGVRPSHRNMSYFEKFVAAVWTEGAVKVGGEAYTGSTAITAQGTYLTKDPARNGLMEQTEYRHIITNNQFELNQAVLLLNRFSSDKFMRIWDVAALLAQATDTTFQALFLHNQKVAKLQGAVQFVKLSLV